MAVKKEFFLSICVMIAPLYGAQGGGNEEECFREVVDDYVSSLQSTHEEEFVDIVSLTKPLMPSSFEMYGLKADLASSDFKKRKERDEDTVMEDALMCAALSRQAGAAVESFFKNQENSEVLCLKIQKDLPLFFRVKIGAFRREEQAKTSRNTRVSLGMYCPTCNVSFKYWGTDGFHKKRTNPQCTLTQSIYKEK